ncbi:hypothetical protein [Arenimonas daejeonensis]|uniref:hypothetical protein n=1 Tax=Arenimonas daejeonensis TaxID=370777 RepID=UPI0011BF9BB3|nr:hypothetical protein [Arenimonas daejeonensis]
MAKPRPSPSNDGRKLIATAIAAACLGLAGGARADASAGAYVSLDEAPSKAESLGEQRLFLEIFHDDRPIGLVAEMRLRDQRMWATPQELGEIGLIVPANLATDDEGLVPLDALPGLSWRYDAAAQRLHLGIPPSLRPEQALGYKAPTAVKADRSSGWRLGYDAYGQHAENIDTLAWEHRWPGSAGWAPSNWTASPISPTPRKAVPAAASNVSTPAGPTAIPNGCGPGPSATWSMAAWRGPARCAWVAASGAAISPPAPTW